MALKGNLRDFTITQLLNLVNLAKKTGTLEIQGSGGAATVVFREGKLAYAQFANEDASLASILHRGHPQQLTGELCSCFTPQPIEIPAEALSKPTNLSAKL